MDFEYVEQNFNSTINKKSVCTKYTSPVISLLFISFVPVKMFKLMVPDPIRAGTKFGLISPAFGSKHLVGIDHYLMDRKC